MALTINDKKFIANLLDQKLDHQEQKFEAKIIQIKSTTTFIDGTNQKTLK